MKPEKTPFCVAKPNRFACDKYDYYTMTFFSRDEQPWKSNVNSQESNIALKGHLDFKCLTLKGDAALTEWPTSFTVVSMILLYDFTDCLRLGFLTWKSHSYVYFSSDGTPLWSQVWDVIRLGGGLLCGCVLTDTARMPFTRMPLWPCEYETAH